MKTILFRIRQRDEHYLRSTAIDRVFFIAPFTDILRRTFFPVRVGPCLLRSPVR